MKLTPPKQNVFWISTVLSALGLVANFVSIPFVSAYAVSYTHLTLPTN